MTPPEARRDTTTGAAEIPVPRALVQVLKEAGIELVFGMPGGDRGRIFDALHDAQPGIRTILVRLGQVGSIMAEMYGRLKDGQRRRGNRFIASELGQHDYARMADAMGGRGVRVETLDDLASALDALPRVTEPTVLDGLVTEEAPFWRVRSPLAKDGPGGE